MDSPQRPCLPSYPCLTALVCDLQSMLHRTLPHLTVITNKHHAQSLRLLFCLLRCQFLTEAQVWRRQRSTLASFLSQRTHWVERKKTGRGRNYIPRQPHTCPLMPRCLEGNIQQHRKDLLGGGEEAESQPYTVPALGQKALEVAATSNSMYWPRNFRVKEEHVNKSIIGEGPRPCSPLPTT